MAELSTVIGWVSVQEAIDRWPDAPGEEADGYAELVGLLATAHEFLEPKARPLDPPPVRYQSAQLLYARHLWAREKAGNGDTIGADGFQVSTYPLVLEALSLVRVGRSPFRGLR